MRRVDEDRRLPVRRRPAQHDQRTTARDVRWPAQPQRVAELRRRLVALPVDLVARARACEDGGLQHERAADAQEGEVEQPALLVTLQITLGALVIATIGGVGLAVLFAQSKWVEMSFFPYAVILQVTPVIVIAPLIFIYVPSKIVGLLICAWIVAFFPILSNTTLGLNSADHNLRNLFQLYGASRWQTLWHLRLPSALPYFLGGLKIAGGLSLIGAIVAEFVAGTGGLGSGLAFKILEASYRLNIPRMFAAIVLISLTGIVIFASLSILSHLMLRRWHESAIKRDG